MEDVAAALGLAEGSTIRWHNAVPSDLTLPADAEHLYRVLNNLMRNAIQAMPEGGDLRVAAAISGREAVIEIADTGSGLNNEVSDHLFEPFRGSRNGGTGLGLAIARGWYARMAASLNWHAPGHWARPSEFACRLPVNHIT